MIKRLIIYCKKYWPRTFSGKLSVLIISIWLFFALLSPFIANDAPILARDSSGWSMPILSKENIKIDTKYSFSINPIIPYRFDNLDLENPLKPPLSKGKRGLHILGTDKLGRDVAAGMINGARVAFIIATSAIILSSVFGIFIGLCIGFYGDQGIKKNVIQQFLYLILVIFMIYYLSHLTGGGISIYTVLPIFVLGSLAFVIDKLVSKLPLKKYGLPIDLIVQRLFEIKESVPSMFLILAFIAIVTTSSLYTIPLILAFLYWMTFARQARAEALQIREEEYVKSAKASGMQDVRLIIRHILPNALPSLLVIIAFSFSSVILLESTLSFLGIGLPLEEVSWGKILAEAKKSNKSWWLAIFPGLAIFLVLFSFNTVGDLLANYQRKDDR